VLCITRTGRYTTARGGDDAYRMQESPLLRDDCRVCCQPDRTTGHQQFQQRIMHGAMIQTLLGLAVGIPVALLSARFVQSQLYEIASVHPLVLTGAVLTLAVAACIAGLIPALRGSFYRSTGGPADRINSHYNPEGRIQHNPRPIFLGVKRTLFRPVLMSRRSFAWLRCRKQCVRREGCRVLRRP
jgi:hypothetical protein